MRQLRPKDYSVLSWLPDCAAALPNWKTVEKGERGRDRHAFAGEKLVVQPGGAFGRRQVRKAPRPRKRSLHVYLNWCCSLSVFSKGSESLDILIEMGLWSVKSGRSSGS